MMKRTGPDSLVSWGIAASCCFLNMMLFGMTRISGMLFVASMPRYHVTREQASFPYAFANFVRNSAGPLIGYLGHKLGVRRVTTFGCLLAAIGVAACFLAESVISITAFWGVLFGLGFGLGNILLPVKINQYFNKRRATASGISYAGACIGSFLIPPILESLLDTYGLSGSFLILAGLVLHCVPAALLLRRPDFSFDVILPGSEELEKDSEKQSITSRKKIKFYTVDSRPHVNPLQVGEENVIKSSLTYDEKMKGLSTQTLVSNYSVRMSVPEILDFEQILANSKGRRQVDPAALESDVSSTNSFSTDPESTGLKDNISISTSPEAFINRSETPHKINRAFSDGSIKTLSKYNSEYQHSSSFSEVNVNHSCEINHEHDQKRQKSHSMSSKPEEKSASEAFKVILDPLFLLVAITNALYCFTFVCMMTVIVDFSEDINVEPSSEKYILMSLSIGDFVGRLGLGWITDDGYMSRTFFAAVCFLFQGISITAIAWSTGFSMLVTLIAFYGLTEAGLIVIFPLIIAQYIETGKQTVAIPSTQFLAGPLCLTVAPLIGYVRDVIGSYEYIFIGLGLISFACCIACLLAPCIVRYRENSTIDKTVSPS